MSRGRLPNCEKAFLLDRAVDRIMHLCADRGMLPPFEVRITGERVAGRGTLTIGARHRDPCLHPLERHPESLYGMRYWAEVPNRGALPIRPPFTVVVTGEPGGTYRRAEFRVRFAASEQTRRVEAYTRDQVLSA